MVDYLKEEPLELVFWLQIESEAGVSLHDNLL